MALRRISSLGKARIETTISAGAEVFERYPELLLNQISDEQFEVEWGQQPEVIHLRPRCSSGGLLRSGNFGEQRTEHLLEL